MNPDFVMKYFLIACLLPCVALAASGVPTPAGALADATAAGDARAVASALERGADPNAIGDDGLTPLMRAARSGSFECVRTLLWEGARADRANAAGKKAFDAAPAPSFKGSETGGDDLRRYLVQILLRCYVRLERHGERASSGQPVARPSLVLLDTAAVDYRAPALARSIALNTAEANGVMDQDDDGNGFVDDIFGWRGQPDGPWRNDPAFDTIFGGQKDLAARLLQAHAAAQLGGAAEKAALQSLELELSDPKRNAPSLLAALAVARGTQLASLLLEASDGQAQLQFITIPTTVPRPSSGPLCESYLVELAREFDSPDEFCERLLERILTEQIGIGKSLSKYVRKSSAGVVLLPPMATHGLEETVACVEEIFAARAPPRGRLSLSLINRLRWELLSFEALPAALMVYENPNVLFVCAAGDESRDVDAALIAPAGLSRFFPNAVTATSVDGQGSLSAFANFGRHSVQLAAPGEKVTSLAPAGLSITTSSSSVAAARVAGVAANLRTAVPRLTAFDLRQLLVEAADAAAPPHRPALLNAVRVREFLPGNSPAALKAHATQLRITGRFHAASLAIEAALNVNKSAPNWVEQAEIQHASGIIPEAISTLGKALKLEPSSLPLLLRRAAWHRELGDLAGFTADYDAALTLAPDDFVLANTYAQALFGMKAYRRSAQLFRDQLDRAKAAKQPVEGDLLAGLAMSLWPDEATRPEAISHYRELIAMEPGYGDAGWLRARGWSAEPLAALQALKADVERPTASSKE